MMGGRAPGDNGVGGGDGQAREDICRQRLQEPVGCLEAAGPRVLKAGRGLICIVCAWPA